MVNNASIPTQARYQVQLKQQQLQMELHHAQTFIAMAAAQSFSSPAAAMACGMDRGIVGWIGDAGVMGMQGGFREWTNPFPLNNRQRSLKRNRPSDFEIACVGTKAPRFGE